MKTAVVTGASRGIGRAVAERLSEDGWRLLLNCKSRFPDLDALASSLSQRTPCIPVHGPMDAEAFARYLSMPEAPLPDTGDELLLVNNAGISRTGLLQDMEDKALEALFQSNLWDMVQTTRGILPYMLKNKLGRIINISSVWGVCGASMETVYSMTKGGINAFTKALAKELAPSHIPVNALAPGAVDTEMNAWMRPEERESLKEEIPYGRMAQPEEVAEMVRLLSLAPRYLTGQVIRFDGGWI